MRKNSFSETILIACLLALSLVYLFYFVLIPQNWSLISCYKFALQWGGPSYHPISAGTDFVKELASLGRFCPIYSYALTFWYWLLPVTPRAFHVLQFVIAGAAFSTLYLLLRRMGLSFLQSILALTVVAGSFPMKDWIFVTTSQEPLGTLWLMVTLALYATGRKWLAVPFYMAAALTMESFAVFGICLFVLEAWDYRSSGQRPKLLNLLPFLVCFVLALALAAFVYSLPHVYAQNAALLKIGIPGVLRSYATAFILPPVKSLLPVILLVAYSRWRMRNQPLEPNRIRVFLLGLSIVVSYTLVLGTWAPFDSWFYLHETIPFGWAMMLAALWSPESLENDRIHLGLLLSCFGFFILVAMNGSRHLTTGHSEVATVARIACEESQRVPGLQIYSNCNEGSVELRNSLILSKDCANPPVFHYLNHAPSLTASTAPPYLFILSPSCDAFDSSTVPADFVLPLNQWTVIKKF